MTYTFTSAAIAIAVMLAPVHKANFVCNERGQCWYETPPQSSDCSAVEESMGYCHNTRRGCNAVDRSLRNCY